MNKTINDKRKREINQLWFLGKHYFRLSKSQKNELSGNLLNRTIKYFADNYCRQSNFIGETRKVMLMTAHLTSCAVRLSTIDEILGGSISERQKIYYGENGKNGMNANKVLEKKELEDNVENIIHFLLRHNTAHHEPLKEDKPQYIVMKDFLNDLTMEKVYEKMEIVIEKIKKDISEIIKC